MKAIYHPLVFYQSKLSHNGITGYKVFEGFPRKAHKNSLRNLLNQKVCNDDLIKHLSSLFRMSLNNDERSRICDQAVDMLSPSDYQAFLHSIYLYRKLNPNQSRKLKSLCTKLSYYSATRTFTSKKTGTYTFRVAFLTLTAPQNATVRQRLKAFESFLDYIRRTAHCVYVAKKELGEESQQLHFHLLINNFIPFYIIEWKWRRLLIAQGVEWPLNAKGQPTTSHYRIEIPRSRKLIAHYIAKYMSKAYALPGECGYISCHSRILDECEESKFIENELPDKEIQAIMSKSKVIRGDYVTHVCCDLLKVKAIAPTIGALFEFQYQQFAMRLTLPQRFHEC